MRSQRVAESSEALILPGLGNHETVSRDPSPHGRNCGELVNGSARGGNA